MPTRIPRWRSRAPPPTSGAPFCSPPRTRHAPPTQSRPSCSSRRTEEGDSGEQQSWLRSLPLLPHPERFLAAAIDACRTNILPQFESIACENPFPARYYPERNFNQLVLKALFNNLAMIRIVGLERRFNAELSRMADDYVSEREAAGRSVPADIWLVIGPQAAGSSLDRMQRYLQHDDAAHRHWAGIGLGLAKSATAKSAAPNVQRS